MAAAKLPDSSVKTLLQSLNDEITRVTVLLPKYDEIDKSGFARKVAQAELDEAVNAIAAVNEVEMLRLLLLLKEHSLPPQS